MAAAPTSKAPFPFQVGDMVQLVRHHADSHRVTLGMIGTVRHGQSPNWIGVDWGSAVNGHDLQGAIDTPTGWYVDPHCLAPYSAAPVLVVWRGRAYEPDA